MRKITKAIGAVAVASAVAATMGIAAGAEKAGVVFQLGNYVHRDSIGQANPTSVVNSAWLDDNGPCEDYEGDETLYKVEGSFVDADVTADGTYTVTASFDTADHFGTTTDSANFVRLSTMIHADEHPDVEITIDSVTFGDKTYEVGKTFINPELAEDGDLTWEKGKPTVNAAVPNPDDFTDQDISIGIFNNWTDGANILTDDNKFNEALTDGDTMDISITFTVANYDGAAADEEPADEEPADEEPADETPAETETKPNTNTGAEGIALAAGVAVLATGAAIVAKKRK